MNVRCLPLVNQMSFKGSFLSWLLSVHDECRHTETISTHGGLCYIVPKLLHQCSLYASSHFFPENRVTFFWVLDFSDKLCMHNILQIILNSSWSLWICFLECSLPDSETYFFCNKDLNPVSGHLSATRLPGTLTIICPPISIWKYTLGVQLVWALT